MARPILYGADYSVYVRIAQLALIEKGVDYELVPMDIFAAGGPPEWYAAHHPFGRIPAFEHDGFKLYETSAICRYVDEAFDGSSLQPSDARGRATMNQIIGMLDAYAYRPMVWDVAVQRLERPETDEDLVASGLEKSHAALSALAALKKPGDWLLGEQLTLADLHAAAIIAYFAKAPEGRAALARQPDLARWYGRLSARTSFSATEATV